MIFRAFDCMQINRTRYEFQVIVGSQVVQAGDLLIIGFLADYVACFLTVCASTEQGKSF